MKFKFDHFEYEFFKLNVRLQIITYALDAFCLRKFNKELVVTAIYRNEKGTVHYYFRGLDYRIKTQAGEIYFTTSEVKEQEEFCQRFEYQDDGRDLPTLYVHDAGSGLHGHLQVSNEKFTKIVG